MFADWLTEGRFASLDRRLSIVIETVEVFMSASTDAFAELDAQLDAVDSYIKGEDAADAAEVAKRTQRIRDLLAAVNPIDPAPAPGDPGAVVPDPSAPVPDPTSDGGHNPAAG